jgi:hypothetical protein
MATLNDITKKSKSLADSISKKVASYAPRKTGNLQNALKRANNVNTMFEAKGGLSKSKTVKSLEFTYDYAPDGAEYGMFWNDPTVSSTVRNGKTKNVPRGINFAEKGLNDPQVIKKIDELADMISESILFRIEEELKAMESEY